MAEEKDKQKKRSQNSSTDISDTVFKVFKDPEAGKSAADLESTLLKIDSLSVKMAADMLSKISPKSQLGNVCCSTKKPQKH
jgi:hypothetical protein